jgi:predicted acyl esterase
MLLITGVNLSGSLILLATAVVAMLNWLVVSGPLAKPWLRDSCVQHHQTARLRRSMRLGFLILLIRSGTALPAVAQQMSTGAGDFVLESDVAVTMRDGIALLADVLLPRGEGAFPVFVYRTPYGKEFALKDCTTFRPAVERGYVVVVPDVRGHYTSEGPFRRYPNEGRDGYDTIEWAARRPWSNGAVGTFGLSYPVVVQWLAAGSTAKTKSGEREFGPAAAIDYDEVVLRWMDHYLREHANGVGKPVRYFVMGHNQWREIDAWPPPSRATSYYLASPKSSEGRGSLSTVAPSAKETFGSFLSDPAKAVTNWRGSSEAHDYRELAKRDDVLTFDSAPLDRDTEATSPIHAQIYLACDCRDTALWVRLLDVAPDGIAFNLMSPGLDLLRASYRELKRGRQLLTPCHVYELHVDNLITSNVFQKDHLIRVQLSATFFPNFSRNVHTGELDAPSARLRKASIHIYTDRRRPSRVILPIVA